MKNKSLESVKKMIEANKKKPLCLRTNYDGIQQLDQNNPFGELCRTIKSMKKKKSFTRNDNKKNCKMLCDSGKVSGCHTKKQLSKFILKHKKDTKKMEDMFKKDTKKMVAKYGLSKVEKKKTLMRKNMKTAKKNFYKQSADALKWCATIFNEDF